MSTLATPPEERHPILTFVGPYDERQITAAIRPGEAKGDLTERQEAIKGLVALDFGSKDNAGAKARIDAALAQFPDDPALLARLTGDVPSKA